MNRLKNLISPLLFISIFFSCASHHENSVGKNTNFPESASMELRKIIVQQAVNNIGLPYHWGGQSPKTGFDCSGLIVYTYKKADIILPRTAKALYLKGKTVSEHNMQIADLVFFKPPQGKSVYHVGLYIGDRIFIHAPGKSRHVTYGKLNNPYFEKYYIGSRSYF